MEITIKLDKQAMQALEMAAVKSAEATMEQVYSDIVSSETMPFDVGDMQNSQTFVAVDDNKVSLVTGSSQARRLYYHPEYNFQQGKNANAGGEWLEPYISGDKKDFIPETFAELFKKETGV